MRHCTRTVCAFCLIAALTPALPLPVAAAEPSRWEVTLAIRLVPTGPDPVSVRIAIPPSGPRQQVAVVDLSPRGLESSADRESEHPHFLVHGKLKGPRRIAVTYRVETLAESTAVPAVGPLRRPDRELLPYMGPSPLFQSRSLLVREFLESEVAPSLYTGTSAVLRPILAATRRELKHRRDGKSLVLDVIRSRQGKRIGIERAFTTFLRCAGIPARLVEGINLESATRRKRVFWTEAWSGGRWWPVSASRGWAGQLPAHYLAVANDGRRIVQVSGPAQASYTVKSFPITVSE